MEDPREILRRYMEDKGLRSTHQRDLIVDAFLKSGQHISLEDLHRAVRRRDAAVGFATVYRTMKLLCVCGVASERHFGDGHSRYEPAVKEHHDHLICLQCGAIIEFEDDHIETLQDRIAAKYGYRLLHHKHELYGYCKRCQKK